MKFINDRSRNQAKRHLENDRFEEALAIYVQHFKALQNMAEKNLILTRQKNFLDTYTGTLLDIIKVKSLMIDKLRVDSVTMDKNSLVSELLALKGVLTRLVHYANDFIEVYDSIENKKYLKTTRLQIKNALKPFVLNMESLSDLASEIAETIDEQSVKVQLLALSAQSMNMAIDYRNRFPIPELQDRYRPSIGLHLAFLLSTEQQYQLTKNVSHLEAIAAHMEAYQLLELRDLRPAEELELLWYGLEVDYYLYEKPESDLIHRGNRLIRAGKGLDQQGISDFRAVASLFDEQLLDSSSSDSSLDFDDFYNPMPETSQSEPSMLDLFFQKNRFSLAQASDFRSPVNQINPIDSPAQPERDEPDSSSLSLLSHSPFRHSFFNQVNHQDKTVDEGEENNQAVRVSYNRF